MPGANEDGTRLEHEIPRQFAHEQDLQPQKCQATDPRRHR